MKQGDIYLVNVEFVKVPGSKVRPVLVIDLDNNNSPDILIIPLGSRTPFDAYDVPITNREYANLSIPRVGNSTAICRKAFPVSKNTLRAARYIGALHPDDLRSVLASYQRFITNEVTSPLENAQFNENGIVLPSWISQF